MAEAGLNEVLRRKIAAQRAAQAEGSPGADRSWRMALARSARDALGLALDVTGLRIKTQSLAEVLELPFDHALISVLQGPSEGMGLMLMTPEVLAGVIEVQTYGKVGTTPVDPRKPTRTDAAMVAPLLDAALIELEQQLVEEADLVWAGGFRYASFLDDARPLGLLMEDISYRLLSAEVSLGLGARKGSIYMALPAKGRGLGPAYASPAQLEDTVGAQSFSQDFAAQVDASACVLEAILARVSLPLGQVMALNVGAVVPLGRATIDRLGLSGINGAQLTEGKLGQHRGMRAIRLSLPQGDANWQDSAATSSRDLAASAQEDEMPDFGLPMAQVG
jgi:flagellar motor switch protein FliM